MKRINCDSIIFDMDGVLISNESYNQTIIKTAEYFLFANLNKKIDVTTQEIYQIKKISGFNNDWDVSFALINLFEKEISVSRIAIEVQQITSDIRRSNKYKIIKDIFQSYYLGRKIFQKIYQKYSPIKIDKGLINSEKLLFEISNLNLLFEKYKLAIATSRPRFEAIYAAKIQNISPDFIRFKSIIAKEDCRREKPYPDPLIKARKRINGKKSVYIGDTINDVLAAKSANMLSIYVGKENIGDIQVNNVNEIKEYLL